MNKRIIAVVLIVAVVSLIVMLSNDLHLGTVKEYGTNTKSKSVTNKESFASTTVTPMTQTYITLFHLPNGTAPNSILVDKNEIVWCTGSKIHDLFRLDPKKNSLQRYEIPGENNARDQMSWSMVQDNEGNIWFSQFGQNPVWRFDPNNETFTSFHSGQKAPFQMKHDPKTDNIWFTTLSDDSIGVIQKIGDTGLVQDQYKINEFPIGNGSLPSGLYIHGGSILVAELGKSKVVKFDVVTSSNGTVTGIKQDVVMPRGKELFSLPTDVLYYSKGSILWVTEHGPSTFTKYDTISQKSIRFPTAMNPNDVASLPFWLRESTDGNGIWFNEHEGGSVGFMANNLTLTEFHLPDISSTIPLMLNLATDPTDHDKLWFSLWTLDEIGYVNKSVPNPFDISVGKDKVLLSKSHNQSSIDVTVTRKPSPVTNGTVYLNASSSMVSDASLQNMTAKFSRLVLHMAEKGSAITTRLVLTDRSLQSGNYTIGVYADNPLVSRSVFVYVSVP